MIQEYARCEREQFYCYFSAKNKALPENEGKGTGKAVASKELPRLVKNLGLAGINRQAYEIGMQAQENSWLNNDMKGCLNNIKTMEENLKRMKQQVDSAVNQRQ